ncbi:MAG: MFS transporter, partial [Leucobacter sp.]|nr:MFS transporter [Leucobacter sp.]
LEGKGKIDIWGAITVTLGFGALVYGFTLAEEGWARVDTIGFIAAGVLLVIVFGVIETRVSHPLLPLRVIFHKVRAGAYIVQAMIGAVLIGSTMYLTFHLQLVLGMAPLAAGLATVVMTASTLAVVPVFTKLLPVWGARVMMIAGPVVGALGMFYMSGVTADGNYFVQVLPGLVLVGAGVGITFVPLQNLALVGVQPSDAGAAAATVNVAMQLGGSIGLSVFALAAASASRAVAATQSHVSDAEVMAAGYGAVFFTAGVALTIAAVAAFVLVRGTKEQLLPSRG